MLPDSAESDSRCIDEVFVAASRAGASDRDLNSALKRYSDNILTPDNKGLHHFLLVILVHLNPFPLLSPEG